jgi:hypothetical protein
MLKVEYAREDKMFQKDTGTRKIFAPSFFHGSAQNKLKNYIFMLFMLAADWGVSFNKTI